MEKKILEPIQVGNMTLKNRIMFPPLTTGYEERDGSIGARSLGFYERLAKGGAAYIVIGDVAPVRTASPTPMLYDDSQIPAFEKLANALHAHGSKLALQIFHPEYDVPGVGKLIMTAQMARKAAAEAQAAGNQEEYQTQTKQAEKVTKEAYAKLRYEMQHFVDEATKEQLSQICQSIAQCAARAQKAGVDAIEVHGDRLLGSMCSKLLNHRTDEYGGSLENRTRYALEVVAAIREAAPGECIRECLNCNKGCVDAIQNRRYISCVLNAENGDETTIFIKPSEDIKKVAIVGGGIAGLEAARVAAKRGHQVVLFEKGEKIGGQIHLAAVPPRKSEILRAVSYYEKILPTLHVDLKLHTEPTAEELNGFDSIIVAVGAHNMALPMPVENSNVVSSWDVLKGTEVSGTCVVLGGGLVGTETAEYLADKGYKVAIVEMLDKIAAGESGTVLPLITKDFEKHGVAQHVSTKVNEIRDNVMYATNLTDNTEAVISADTIVNALGSRKNIFDAAGITAPITYIGDCSGERTADIAAAIRSAYHAANDI